jgi:hypothetical protein
LIQIGQKLGPDFLHRKGGGNEDTVGILF